MVKKVFACLLLLVGFGLFSACNLDFLSDITALPDGSADYHYVLSADGLEKRCYDVNDNLVWIERYTKDGSGNILTSHHYSASDVLLYYTNYSYDSNKLVLEIQYDASNTIQYMQCKQWAGDNLTKAMRFGPSNGSAYPLQWAIEYSYSGALCSLENNYGPDGVMTGTVVHTWDGTPNETRRDYNTNAAAAANPTPQTVASVLTAGVWPAITLTGASVALSHYVLWFYDSYGQSRVDLTATNELTRIERTDSRLPRPAGVTASSTIVTALSWDNAVNPARPLKKTTTFNGRTALEIGLGYAGDGSINRLDASGSAMMLPLSFAVSYKSPGSPGTGSFTNVPNTLSVSSNGVGLYSFQYVWDVSKLPASPTSTTSLLALTPADFALGPLTINNFDGDNKFLGSYVFSQNASPAGFRLAAYKPDGSSNGWFVLAQTGGTNISFEGFNAAGSSVYSYTYGYAADLAALENLARNTYLQASAYTIDVNKIVQLITSLDPRKIIDALY